MINWVKNVANLHLHQQLYYLFIIHCLWITYFSFFVLLMTAFGNLANLHAKSRICCCCCLWRLIQSRRVWSSLLLGGLSLWITDCHIFSSGQPSQSQLECRKTIAAFDSISLSMLDFTSWQQCWKLLVHVIWNPQTAVKTKKLSFFDFFFQS